MASSKKWSDAPLSTIRVTRLLLTLSSDVTATDDEAMRAFSTGPSSLAILNFYSVTGPPKEVAGSARGVYSQGRVFHPSIAAVGAAPNGRAPFFSSSSTRGLTGLFAGWTSLAGNKMQGFSSESSRTGRSHELQIPGTLGGRTKAEWALPLSLFAGLARQSALLWVVVLLFEHHIIPPLFCCCFPAGFG